MIELHEVIYCMHINGGGDHWTLYGQVTGHPRFPDYTYVRPSTPVEFDEATDILKTVSGSQYKLVSYGSDKTKIVEQIKKDIAAGGYEVH
jgi:hypothetical protein